MLSELDRAMAPAQRRFLSGARHGGSSRSEDDHFASSSDVLHHQLLHLKIWRCHLCNGAPGLGPSDATCARKDIDGLNEPETL